MAKDAVEKKRMALLEDVDVEAAAGRISQKAWREAKIAHAQIKKCGIDRETGEPATYRMTTRDKQKLFLDFFLNVSQDPLLQRTCAAWCIENPGDFIKIMMAQNPKEISVSGEVLHGVMIVPSREKDIAGWMERMEEQKEAERPFVLDEVNWKTTPHEIEVVDEG